MRTTVTAKIRIKATSEIVKTLNIYGKGLQFCINTAWDKHIRNNIKLHPFVYQHLRDIGLQSQLAIACIKQACGMVKKAKTKPIINNVSMRYNFPRSASFKNNVLSLATVKGRVKIPFQIPKCYVKYFTWNVTESLLRIDKKGRCFFLFTFSKEINATEQNSCSQNIVLGIDLGVNNLAVCSDGRFYNSAKVKRTKRKFKYLRSKLQSKGTRSSKRLLKKISGREKRFMAWCNHNISKDIVSNFNGNKIVMENLKGIRKQRKGRKMNWVLSNWSFFQLQNFIQYKAERKGITVDRVKPNYTSQICSNCGKLGSRSKHSFSCLHCGFSLNSDLNGSRNLAHPKLDERQASVTKPNIRMDDFKGNSQVAIANDIMDNQPESVKPRPLG